MDIDWSHIPEQFRYLRNQALDRLGGDCRIASFDKSLDRHVMPSERLTTQELEELASVHSELCRREDNLPLIDWIKSIPYGTEKHLSAWSLHGLLFLLAELARREIAPFDQHPILIEHPKPPLNWATLPSDLSFLKRAVERYYGLEFEGQIVDWVSSATEDDIRELEELAEKIRVNRKAIEKWQEQHRKTREEFKVNWLFLILYHAGIEVE